MNVGHNPGASAATEFTPAGGDTGASRLTPLDWNIIVTSRERQQRRLRRALFRLVRLQPCGFRNVFVGHVQALEAFLTGVAERLAHRPELEGWLGKVLPLERTFTVDLARFDEQLREATAALVDRLAGRSFHVRVERRGHKGVINTHACEQALGGYLYAALEARGAHPAVAFRDPDVVIGVELMGDIAGISVVTRELREHFPFVKID
jgi:tRNA(Ser,Leu) C12 N-acetylase TAN1